MHRLKAAAVMLVALGALPADAAGTAPYARKALALSTPWTDSVSTTAPLPEYPRPQLRRRDWLSLNGRWQYEPAESEQAPPFGHELAETILVPFPVQSPLSGIERGDQAGWYRRDLSAGRAEGRRWSASGRRARCRPRSGLSFRAGQFTSEAVRR